MSQRSPGELLKQVGNNIRRHRKVARLTQEGLAEAAHLSTYFIGSVERGQAALSLRSLLDIACALDVPVPSLFDDGKEPLRDDVRRKLEAHLKRASDDDLRLVLELVNALARKAR